MRRRAFLAVTVAGFMALSVAAALRWHDAVPIIPARSAQIPRLAAPAGDTADTTLADAEESIVSNDPFRLSNAPASVRYDPRGELAADVVGVAQPTPVRPMMTLKAIVGGPPWLAVVDGLPGQPANTLVRAGASYDKLVVRSVTRDSVVIQGPDTTWGLSFRRPE